MRGEFVRRMRSRGRNMKRSTNSRRRQEEFGRDEHKSDFQHREREMEMEKREHEHHFQLERMQREHEIEMERLERDHKIEMHEHGFPSSILNLNYPTMRCPMSRGKKSKRG